MEELMADINNKKRGNNYKKKARILNSRYGLYDQRLEHHKNQIYFCCKYYTKREKYLGIDYENIDSSKNLITKRINEIKNITSNINGLTLKINLTLLAKQHLDTYLKCLEDYCNSEMKSLKTTGITKPSVGRPSIKPRLGLALFEALEDLVGSRFHIDTLGAYIHPNGELNKRLGDIVFNKMNIPTPNLENSERWEKDIKKSLKLTIKKHMKNGYLSYRDRSDYQEWERANYEDPLELENQI